MKLKVDALEISLDKTKLEYITSVENKLKKAKEDKLALEKASQDEHLEHSYQLHEKDVECLNAIEFKNRQIEESTKKQKYLIGLLIITLSSMLLQNVFFSDLIKFISYPFIWIIKSFLSVTNTMSGIIQYGCYFLLIVLITVVTLFISYFIYLYKKQWNNLSIVTLIASTCFVTIFESYFHFMNELLLIWMIQVAYLVFCFIAHRKMNPKLWKRIQNCQIEITD